MNDLISRLEASAGPDRELDLAILNEGAEHKWYRADEHYETVTFTGSVDDALTLVPEGVYWIMAKGRTRPDEPLYAIQLMSASWPSDVLFAAEHLCLEHAIIIAALKARAHQKERSAVTTGQRSAMPRKE